MEQALRQKLGEQFTPDCFARFAARFSYVRGDLRDVDAYEALLSDIIRGDATNFIRFDEVEWAWRVVDPILKFWAQKRDFVHAYPAGSWGPEEANGLFENAGQLWRDQV